MYGTGPAARSGSSLPGSGGSVAASGTPRTSIPVTPGQIKVRETKPLGSIARLTRGYDQDQEQHVRLVRSPDVRTVVVADAPETLDPDADLHVYLKEEETLYLLRMYPGDR